MRLPSTWSACGWISAQSTIMQDGKLRVAGMMVADVQQVSNHEMDEFECNAEDVLQWLRQQNPFAETLSTDKDEMAYRIESYCRAFVGDAFSDRHIPTHPYSPNFEDSLKPLELAWGSEASWEELYELGGLSFQVYLKRCHEKLMGRCFFLGNDGLVGLAPAGTRQGDLICVLLGCRFPVVLRRSSVSEFNLDWLVIGVCHVQGLMDGETIYGGKIPSHYRFISQTERYDDLINGQDSALYDPKLQTFRTDPAEILIEAGIKVEKYQRNPHPLEVLPETLRAAGIPLQYFDLV